MPDDLVLYGNDTYSSPYVFSAFVTLREKGVSFRLELLSLEKREHDRPEYARASFTGKVPALRHGEFWLAESSAIDEYVDEAFPPPGHPRLYPEDPRLRAKARMIQAFLRTDLLALRNERPTSTLFQGEPVKPLAWKDTVDVPIDGTVRLAVTFDDRPGSWMYHCHILDHADGGLMGTVNVGVEGPGHADHMMMMSEGGH